MFVLLTVLAVILVLVGIFKVANGIRFSNPMEVLIGAAIVVAGFLIGPSGWSIWAMGGVDCVASNLC